MPEGTGGRGGGGSRHVLPQEISFEIWVRNMAENAWMLEIRQIARFCEHLEHLEWVSGLLGKEKLPYELIIVQRCVCVCMFVCWEGGGGGGGGGEGIKAPQPLPLCSPCMGSFVCFLRVGKSMGPTGFVVAVLVLQRLSLTTPEPAFIFAFYITLCAHCVYSLHDFRTMGSHTQQHGRVFLSCSLINLAVNREQIFFSLNFTCRRQNPGRGISLLTAHVAGKQYYGLWKPKGLCPYRIELQDFQVKWKT